MQMLDSAVAGDTMVIVNLTHFVMLPASYSMRVTVVEIAMTVWKQTLQQAKMNF